jgi:hypothetical protein
MNNSELWVKLGDDVHGIVFGPYHAIDVVYGKHVIMENYVDNQIDALRFDRSGELLYDNQKYTNVRVVNYMPSIFKNMYKSFDINKS